MGVLIMVTGLLLWSRGPWKLVYATEINKYCIIFDDMFTYWPIKYDNGIIAYDARHPKDVCNACNRFMNKFEFGDY